jgi:hypothetical protein
LNQPNPGTSAPLRQLEASVAQLRDVFLPTEKKTAPDTYSDEQIVAAKALLVFAHAELEDYLEAACRDKANRALAAFQAGGVGSLTAFSLMSYCGEPLAKCTDIAKYSEAHTKLAPQFPQITAPATRALLSALKVAVSTFSETCRKNNGVKEANLLPMILPLGIDPLTIDPTWIAELNGFGVDRGAHAHRGLASVKRIDDPFLAADQFMRILDGSPGGAPPAGSKIKIYSLRSLDALLLS